jgi:uncharacterized protein
MHLQQTEGGDAEVIEISALLHDIHRIMQRETGRFCEPKESLPKIKEILEEIDFDKEKTQKVLNAIEHHEEYSFSEGIKTDEIEALILQDADNLDGLGAIGIARAFAFGGANNCPIYDPNTPIKVGEYVESKVDPSEVHHIHYKLLRLKDNMNTKTAKVMAENRHKFIELYLKEFFDEWDGKK